MNRMRVLASAIAALALFGAQAAQAECKLGLLATIPISFVNDQPMVDATINGKPAHLRFTLGSEILFWGNALKDYDLSKASNSSMGTAYAYAGQYADMSAVYVRELDVGKIARKDQYFFILPNVKKIDEAGYFGTSLFSRENDIEIDFPHNEVRIFKSSGCKDDEVLYWGGNYSIAERDKDGYYAFKLGGKMVRGALGGGNEVTFVTPDGARQAGVDLQAAGSLPMGMVAGGMVKPIDASIAVFPELLLGDETIKNLPLAVADIYPDRDLKQLPQVILGADFFRSHRVYISREQKKLYFSYVGGVLFQDIYKRLGAEPPPNSPPTAKH